jgi:hypothetical protein
MEPQPVAKMMGPDGVQPGIADENLEVGARGGIGLEDGGDIFADGVEEAGHFGSVAG